MSKRTHAEFAAREETSVLKILEHATDLLKAAEALKKELDTFRESPDIISVLQRHNKKILQSVQLLNQDEVSIKSSYRREFFFIDDSRSIRRMSLANLSLNLAKFKS